MSDKPDEAAIIKYLLNELIEAKASIALLQARLDAQGHLLAAATLALPLEQRADYFNLCNAMQFAELAQGNANSANMMAAWLNHLKSLCGAAGQEPVQETLQRLRVQALLFADVPDELKAAQAAWLSSATEQEIAQELAEKLAAVRPLTGRAKRPGAGEENNQE